MAQRPIWRGQLRLALVSCPVALYNARHDRSAIRFNVINPETGNRIRMIAQDSETGQELERRNLAKGYEFKKTIISSSPMRTSTASRSRVRR